MKKWTFLLPILLILGVSIYLFAQGNPHIDFSVSDDALTLTGPGGFSSKTAFADIASAALVEEPEYGQAKSGYDEQGMTCGEWENEAWGAYTRCTVSAAEVCILIIKTDGTALAFSYSNTADTKTLFTALQDYFPR